MKHNGWLRFWTGFYLLLGCAFVMLFVLKVLAMHDSLPWLIVMLPIILASICPALVLILAFIAAIVQRRDDD